MLGLFHDITDIYDQTRCVTCHVGNDYNRYTCYGCHEHTPENIKREHVEEGIRNFDHCVACHRSANEQEMPDRERKGEDEAND